MNGTHDLSELHSYNLRCKMQTCGVIAHVRMQVLLLLWRAIRRETLQEAVVQAMAAAPAQLQGGRWSAHPWEHSPSTGGLVVQQAGVSCSG